MGMPHITPFSVLPNTPNAGSANAVNGGSSAYSIVTLTVTGLDTVQAVVAPGGSWYSGQPFTIAGAQACNGTFLVNSFTRPNQIEFICSPGVPLATVFYGGYVVVSAASGVTEPSWFMSNVGGTRYLEAFNTSPQGSSEAPTGFLNAQTDWFLNRSAGPPVYAASPLYNWNGTGTSTSPNIWPDQEGPTGLTGNGFPEYGPATRAQFQSCLVNITGCYNAVSGTLYAIGTTTDSSITITNPVIVTIAPYNIANAGAVFSIPASGTTGTDTVNFGCMAY